jgi:hypothetical protein
MERREVEQALSFFPPPKSPPDIHWDGRDLVLSPDSTWDSGQTYILTVQAEARDARGNRLAATFQTAFSTGPTLDSGRIQGRILREARPVPGALALCYRLPRTRVNPETDTADYVVQADEQGQFVFSYLGDGSYRVFGLDDHDRDWLWNIGSEDIAVPPFDVQVGPPAHAFNLPELQLAGLDTLLPELADCRALSSTWMVVTFDQPIESSLLESGTLVLQNANHTLAVDSIWSPDTLSRTVYLHHPALAADSEHDDLLWRRPGDAVHTDTCAVTPLSPADSSAPPTPPRLRPDTVDAWAFVPERVALLFAEPIDSICTQCFQPDPRPDSFGVSLEHAFAVRISLSAPRRQNEPQKLAVSPRAVSFSSGACWPGADTAYFSLPTPPHDSCGEFELRLEDVTAPDSSLWVRIHSLTGQPPMLEAAASAGRVEGLLLQGDYAVSVLADVDGNRHWSPGWPSPFRPSERFHLSPDTLKVRARFTTEFSLLSVH